MLHLSNITAIIWNLHSKMTYIAYYCDNSSMLLKNQIDKRFVHP